MRVFFRTKDKSSSEFFEGKYRRSADPWNFAGSPYELHRYNVILKALADKHYRRAFEPGCSVGVLTERLAGLCHHVEACDFSASAVTQAQQRCAHLPNVQVQCRPLEKTDSGQRFDLVVLSEIGYYFGLEDWGVTIESLTSPMRPGTTLLASHWLGNSEDHRLSGDEVHELLNNSPNLRHEYGERHEFRLDRWVRI